MPTRYDLVLEWTGEPLDPQEHKRALVRRRIRAKESQWVQDADEQLRRSSGYYNVERDEQGAMAGELAPEYDLVSESIF